MNEVAAIVEGQTEQTFVRYHLAAHLRPRGVNMWATLSGPLGRRGGVGKWESVRGDILRALRQRRGRVCTTMFDFYGMPKDWPGRAEADNVSYGLKGEQVERALLDDLATHAGEDFRPELFIPYVQVHEFEALLFADVAKMAEVLAAASQLDRVRLAARFKDILDKAGQPEAINDGWETCPSRRIASAVPRYTKPTFGPLVAGRIGLEKLRAACPHFGQWVGRLEALGARGAAS